MEYEASSQSGRVRTLKSCGDSEGSQRCPAMSKALFLVKDSMVRTWYGQIKSSDTMRLIVSAVGFTIKSPLRLSFELAHRLILTRRYSPGIIAFTGYGREGTELQTLQVDRSRRGLQGVRAE